MKTEPGDSLNSEDHWANWLANLFIQPECTQRSSKRDIAIHHVIVDSYKSLGQIASKQAFERGLLSYFQAVKLERGNADKLYNILEAITFLKPLRAERYLRSILLDEVLKGLEYAGQELHTMTLVACGKYDLDDVVSDYVLRSVKRCDDLRYMLVAMRALSRRDEEKAFHLLDRLLPLMSARGNIRRILRTIERIVDRVGFRRFYEKYTSSRAKWEKTRPIHFRIFQQELRSSLLPLPVRAYEEDPFAVLLCGELHAGRTVLKPADLWSMASTYDEGVGEERVIETMSRIAEATSKEFGGVGVWSFQQSKDFPTVFDPREKRSAGLCVGGKSMNVDPDRREALLLERARATYEFRGGI